MKKTFMFFVIAVAFLLIADVSFAQCPQNCGCGMGMGPHGGAYSRTYDPKTVETLRGEVMSVDAVNQGGMASGIHLILKTDKETIAVHLGPSWYIENQDTQIQAKDQIEVKGSRIQYNGQPAIVAAEVIKGNEVLKLRDENGIPAWSGWRRK